MGRGAPKMLGVTTPQLFPAVAAADNQTTMALPSRGRALIPKEHGAWGQVSVPLVVALGLGDPSWIALALAVAVLLLFLAHEPLVVLLGQRGTRQLREAGNAARTRLIVLAGAATVLGGGAMLWTTWAVRFAAMLSLALAAVAVTVFLVQKKERSSSGELWAAITLPSALVPTALAAGVEAHIAFACWGSLGLAYAAGVCGVRGLIRGQREGLRSAGWPGLLSVLVGIVGLAGLSVPAALAATLFWSIVAIARASSPSMKSLRQVGWSLVAASIAQAMWLLVALR